MSRIEWQRASGSAAGLTQRIRKSFAYTGSIYSFLIHYIHFKIYFFNCVFNRGMGRHSILIH